MTDPKQTILNTLTANPMPLRMICRRTGIKNPGDYLNALLVEGFIEEPEKGMFRLVLKKRKNKGPAIRLPIGKPGTPKPDAKNMRYSK